MMRPIVVLNPDIEDIVRRYLIEAYHRLDFVVTLGIAQIGSPYETQQIVPCRGVTFFDLIVRNDVPILEVVVRRQEIRVDSVAWILKPPILAVQVKLSVDAVRRDESHIVVEVAHDLVADIDRRFPLHRAVIGPGIVEPSAQDEPIEGFHVGIRKDRCIEFLRPIVTAKIEPKRAFRGTRSGCAAVDAQAGVHTEHLRSILSEEFD